MMKNIYSLLLFIFFSPLCLSAQNPFTHLDISLSGNYIFQGNEITKSWDPTPGLMLDIRTPYFMGELETGVRYVRFSELDFENSGFHSTYVFAGWSLPLQLSERLSLSPGVKIGITYLYQDNAKFYDGYRFDNDESEFSWELQLRSLYKINTNWSIHLTTVYNRTVLHLPMNQWYLSAGLMRRFESPNWIKTFLE